MFQETECPVIAPFLSVCMDGMMKFIYCVFTYIELNETNKAHDFFMNIDSCTYIYIHTKFV